MEKFTASNGWTVTELDDGQVSVTRPAGNCEYVFWLGPTEVDVLGQYLRAKAERKPWDDAADGDIWELHSRRGVAQYLYHEGRFFELPLRRPDEPGWEPASFASDFTAGVRVWPEQTGELA